MTKHEPREISKPTARRASSRPLSASAQKRAEDRAAKSAAALVVAEERAARCETALVAAFQNKDRRTEARAMKMSRRALDRILDGKRGPTRDQLSQLEQRHGLGFDLWDSIYIGQR